IVEDTDAACFDDQVRAARALHGIADVFDHGLVDDDLRPRWIVDIAMLLATVRIRLVKSDFVAAGVQCANDAAVVRRCSVPVSGDQARTEERDPHQATPPAVASSPTSRVILSSSSTRCAHVWR